MSIALSTSATFNGIRRYWIWLPVGLTLAATPATRTGGRRDSAKSVGTIAVVPNGRAHRMIASSPDTTLCALIPVKEFFGAMNAPVGKLRARMTTVKGTQTVSCAFLPSGTRGAAGLISYVFPADAAAFYTRMERDAQESLNKKTDLPGIGTAAFWGTSKGAEDELELKMRKGNVVVALLLDGKVADGSVFLPAATQIAKEIASHF